MARYRLVLQCSGLPAEGGADAARCITDEFAKRPWHDRAACVWVGGKLVLTAENDFDRDGLALRDEFSDAISACVADVFDSEISVVSVTSVAGDLEAGRGA